MSPSEAYEETKIIMDKRQCGWFRAVFVFIGQTGERRRLLKKAQKSADEARERVSRMTPDERAELRKRARELIAFNMRQKK